MTPPKPLPPSPPDLEARLTGEADTRRALVRALDDLQRERDAIERAKVEWLKTVDALAQPLLVHDADGHIVRANAAYARRAGCDIRTLLGHRYWEHFPTGTGPLPGCHGETTDAHVRTGATIEETFSLPDGEIYVSRSVPMPSASGRSPLSLHLFEDVTESRRNERTLQDTRRALEQSERQFRSLIENTSDLLIVVGANGAIAYTSPSVSRVGGYSPSELIGAIYRDFVHPDDADAAASGFADVLAHPEMPHSTQFRFRAKQGGWVVLESVARNALADPAIGGIVINARDVTDREGARQDLARKERYFRKLIEGSADTFYVIDRAGIVMFRSPSAAQLTGWTDEEMVGQDITQYVVREDVTRARQAIDGMIHRPGEAARVEMRLLRKNGPPLEVEATGRNLLADRDVSGIVITARDISERKRTEHARHASELRFQSLIDNMLEGFAHCRMVNVGGVTDFVYLSVNPGFETLTGLKNVTGKTLSAAIPGLRASNPELFEAYARVAAGGKPERLESQVHPLDTWFSIFVYNAGPDQFISVFDNITERRRSEQELRSSEARYRAMFEQATVGVYQTSLDGILAQVNPAFCSMLGYSDSELQGRAFSDLLHPDDRAESAALRASLSFPHSPRTASAVEKRYLRKDGTTLWANVSVAAVREAKGAPEYFVSIVQDISQHKQGQDALRESHLLLMTTERLASIGGFRLDLATEHVVWSDETYRIFGVTSERAPTLENIVAAVHADDRRAVQDAIAVAITGEKPFDVDFRIVRPDGSERFIHSQGEVDRDQAGNPVRLIGTSHDITGRREAEKGLAKVNRVLRTLSAGNEALVRTTNEADLMTAMCRVIVEVGGYPIAWIGRVPPRSPAIVTPVAFGGADAALLRTLPIRCDDAPEGQGPLRLAIETAQPQIRQTFAVDARLQPWREVMASHGVKAEAVFPLAGPSGVFGTLSIYAAAEHAFAVEEISLLQELAADLSYGVGALRDRVAHETFAARLRLGLESAVAALAAMTESRDPYTAGHQRRVADLSLAIAQEIGFDEERARGVFLAAIVHDIGKIQVPTELLSKPGRLSSLEFQLIQTHVDAGYEILRGIDFPWPVADFVRQHHERLDGRGYPLGLKGAAIHLEARIIAVADVVEAMSTHRPYRPARTLETAFAELVAGQGILYDAQVVDACLRLFREKRFQFTRDTVLPMRPPGSTPDLGTQVPA